MRYSNRLAMRAVVGFLSVLFNSAVGSAAAHAQEVAPERSWTIPSNEDIRALLAERMKHNGVGLIVGVLEPSGRRVVAYGKSGRADGRPLDGDTVFQIGSVSKVFVGLVLADMIRRGEVKLDDPAEKYLPAGVKMPQRGRPITLADLSTHMSGLPSVPTNFDLHGEPDPIEAYTVQQLYDFLNSYRLEREPGTRPEYSNVGVSLLGRLLGLRAGVEYEDLLKARVLRPLAMRSTCVHLNPDQLSRLAPGHDKDLKPVHTPEMKTLYPSGSLRSTANDLLNFLEANLGYRRTKLQDAMLYQRSAIRTPTSPAPSAAGPVVEQALGWRVRTIGNREIFGHDGGKQGYRCYVAMDPTRRTGVIVLANARTDERLGALAFHLLAGEPLSPAPAAQAERHFIELDPALLDRYEGRYRLTRGRMLQIARRGGHIYADISGGGPFEMFATSEREFATRADEEEIEFELDADGNVTDAILYPDGRNGRAIVSPRIDSGAR